RRSPTRIRGHQTRNGHSDGELWKAKAENQAAVDAAKPDWARVTWPPLGVSYSTRGRTRNAEAVASTPSSHPPPKGNPARRGSPVESNLAGSRRGSEMRTPSASAAPASTTAHAPKYMRFMALDT